MKFQIQVCTVQLATTSHKKYKIHHSLVKQYPITKLKKSRLYYTKQLQQCYQPETTMLKITI